MEFKMAAPMKICRACFSSSRKFLFGPRISAVGTRNFASKDTAPQSEDETHFGFENVSKAEKTERVHQVFSNVADSYDTMNDAMSLGIHRLWKDYFMQAMLKPTPGTRLLDVAGGTGDIAFRFLDYINHLKQDPEFTEEWPDEIRWSGLETGEDAIQRGDGDPEGAGQTVPVEQHVTVCDINEDMLRVGKKRAKQRGIQSGISWVCGNAEELPIADDSMDAYTIAFGIRNVTNVDQALDEAYRVLKPGGRFLCLEFSEVQNSLLRMAYDRYSFDVIPVLGDVIAGDWKSYKYLVESIRQFPNQKEFSAMIEDAGFSLVRHENLSLGIAAIHSGFKL
ncbi:2-methoxy-6-polyprenyl-1,4-benzoquinol methylase, mitochondrial [Strongylocentrotus purpuratus]|uniref:2-methoxy-6-polyprenyl-1,4-benzoquinol methylase, mitochondrial n=1 Tax=Strongylocentrotus purpuratus TaxID=7668 RepID=A0A7M7RGJ4_STRPU|nr:2-methoxy-6-polyprenyl-1,4-benzoquinol methylase, mitochondrial [Strongylocentrotus purpuratus]|eukprot:XP_790868.3 PREDICTED: 2-methoxy-6-polyprenyl-1,4-benzoquinol methylase, mitochondrial [Strongylocentrotus purpuratus]